MRSVVSRLARLERLSRLNTAPQRLRVQFGYLKTLPDDYIGPRHTVTVRQLPPVEPGEDWFEWEERPGPEPASNATGPNEKPRSPAGFDPDDRKTHMHVIGSSGSSKSKFLEWMIRGDLRNRQGFCLLDPHGTHN